MNMNAKPTRTLYIWYLMGISDCSYTIHIVCLSLVSKKKIYGTKQLVSSVALGSFVCVLYCRRLPQISVYMMGYSLAVPIHALWVPE